MPVVALLASQAVSAQAPPPAWDFAPMFKYKIENVLVNTSTAGTWNVKVIFSVSNPGTGDVWDIKTALPYQTTGAALTIDIGWDPSRDITNTGSASALLTPVVTTALGTAAAAPLQIRNLQHPTTGANRCTTRLECPGVPDFFNRFWVQKAVTPVKFTQDVAMGRVAIEGRAVCNGLIGCPPGPPYANIPVRSEVVDFAFLSVTSPTAAVVPDQRRAIVDFETKCKTCHNDRSVDRNGVPIPRLSLHGGNRNENLKLCVMCHNPNQTDVPYRLLTADARTSGAETPLDMKTMIHSIHSGGFREKPFVVIGFNSSINDFTEVRFPATLSNCLNCHLQSGGKGTFELPLANSVLGTTVKTGSTYAVPAGGTRTISVDPSDDLKITPTAATCSACHDKAEVQSHMVSKGGASFATQQRNIGVAVRERCATCHGPGKEKDVRRVHEISSTEGFYH
jgi:OmcA/MtrC family decaheme c-type cytochrome